ncbi:pirin family protein [Nafulsella turpanensis]|uniref:pirin family protein n=1 Tax=Nafulsella turpanensis TaxID=1265690 RepID=UPI000345E588|nr:pirin family protein [Nafulsella turpanensis]
MKTTFHKADSRGFANHGWLKSHHTFSFAGYYDPERINFGMLRVLNDDWVAPGRGFGEHPHDNMEIVSIPLQGTLAHSDSEGNAHPIKTNDVQIMSAGTGLTHSEFNHSKEEPVSFLQIWVFPKERNIKPRYDQKTFDPASRLNNWQTVVSPEKDSKEALWINQDAWFSLSTLEAGKELPYQLHGQQQGVYLFVLSGTVEVANQRLGQRDAIGISETDAITVKATENSELLLIEVPMHSR